MNRLLNFSVFFLFVGAGSFLTASYLQAHPSLFLISAVCLAVTSVYLFLYFARDPNGKTAWESLFKPQSSSRKHLFLFVFLLLIAIAFRFWRLGSLFDGINWDESYKGLDAIAIRTLGDRPIFLDWNAGREALVAYLVAGMQMLFGNSIFAVRAVEATAGVLSIWVLYLWMRRLCSPNLALLTAFLMTVSKWHIIHSRFGIRVCLIVVFELTVLYFLTRAARSEKKSQWPLIWAGFFGGLGMYTYIAYRIFPVIVLVFLIQNEIRSVWKQQWKGLLAGMVVSIVVFAPLGSFYIQHRQSFTDRMERTALWKNRWIQGTPSDRIVKSAGETFGMFTYRGDSIDRHNLKGEPMLSPFMAPFFLLGLLLAIVSIRKKYAAFLLIYLLLTLLPGILAVGAPSATRTLGAVVPVMILTGIGAIVFLQITVSISRTLAVAMATVIIAGNLYCGPEDALVRYPEALDSLSPYDSALWGMDRDQYRIVQLLNQLGTGVRPYLTPQFFFHSSVQYLTYPNANYQLLTLDSKLLRAGEDSGVAVVFLQPNRANLWWLRDDEGKRFFKWWEQTRDMKSEDIRGIVRRSYVNVNRTTNMSDFLFLDALKKRYPHGKLIDFGTFAAFFPVNGTPGARQ